MQEGHVPNGEEELTFLATCTNLGRHRAIFLRDGVRILRESRPVGVADYRGAQEGVLECFSQHNVAITGGNGAQRNSRPCAWHFSSKERGFYNFPLWA